MSPVPHFASPRRSSADTEDLAPNRVLCDVERATGFAFTPRERSRLCGEYFWTTEDLLAAQACIGYPVVIPRLPRLGVREILGDVQGQLSSMVEGLFPRHGEAGWAIVALTPSAKEGSFLTQALWEGTHSRYPATLKDILLIEALCRMRGLKKPWADTSLWCAESRGSSQFLLDSGGVVRWARRDQPRPSTHVLPSISFIS